MHFNCYIKALSIFVCKIRISIYISSFPGAVRVLLSLGVGRFGHFGVVVVFASSHRQHDSSLQKTDYRALVL